MYLTRQVVNKILRHKGLPYVYLVPQSCLLCSTSPERDQSYRGPLRSDVMLLYSYIAAGLSSADTPFSAVRGGPALTNGEKTSRLQLVHRTPIQQRLLGKHLIRGHDLDCALLYTFNQCVLICMMFIHIGNNCVKSYFKFQKKKENLNFKQC